MFLFDTIPLILFDLVFTALLKTNENLQIEFILCSAAPPELVHIIYSVVKDKHTVQ